MLSLDRAVTNRGASEKSRSETELRFAALFRTGAILQRSMVPPVWGKATPGSWVYCTHGETATVTAPTAVHCAWSNNPVMANLGGENGLPVSPFEVSVNDRFQS